MDNFKEGRGCPHELSQRPDGQWTCAKCGRVGAWVDGMLHWRDGSTEPVFPSARGTGGGGQPPTPAVDLERAREAISGIERGEWCGADIDLLLQLVSEVLALRDAAADPARRQQTPPADALRAAVMGPEDECTLPTMLRKIANHISAGRFTLPPDMNPAEWRDALDAKADALDSALTSDAPPRPPQGRQPQVQCPECDGDGEIETYPPGHLASSWLPTGVPVINRDTCHACGGTGVVPAPTPAPTLTAEDRELYGRIRERLRLDELPTLDDVFGLARLCDRLLAAGAPTAEGGDDDRKLRMWNALVNARARLDSLYTNLAEKPGPKFAGVTTVIWREREKVLGEIDAALAADAAPAAEGASNA